MHVWRFLLNSPPLEIHIIVINLNKVHAEKLFKDSKLKI